MTPAPKRRFLPFAPTCGRRRAGADARVRRQPQSLRELYDAARAYDATYLAARALYDSAQYRVGQAEAAEQAQRRPDGQRPRAPTPMCPPP